MPLPALPPTTTARYRLVYTVSGVTHKINVHQSTAKTSADAVTDATNLANLLKQACKADVIFTAVEYANLGSNVFNQIATLNIAGTNVGAMPNYDVPLYMCFVGRTLSGRKTRLFLFGVLLEHDVNWRIEGAENAPIAAIVSGLNSGVGDVRAIDAGLAVWKNYANVGYHHHYVKTSRRGAG